MYYQKGICVKLQNLERNVAGGMYEGMGLKPVPGRYSHYELEAQSRVVLQWAIIFTPAQRLRRYFPVVSTPFRLGGTLFMDAECEEECDGATDST